MTYDEQLLVNMIAWVGGLAGVTGLTAKITGLFKNASDAVKKIVGYVASILIAFLIPLVYFLLTGQFEIKVVLFYAISMWMVSSGIYDKYHTPEV